MLLGGVPGGMMAFTDTAVQALNTYTYRVIANHDTIDSYSYPLKNFLEPTFPTTKIPFSGDNCEIPGTVEAENYDFGGQGVSSNETTEDNTLGAYSPYEGVDVEEGKQGMRILTLALPDFNLDIFTFSSAVGMKSMEKEELQVYPDPSSDRIFIEMQGVESFNAARIFSTERKVLIQMENVSSMNGLDIRKLLPGLYLLRLEGQTGNIHILFLKSF